MKNSSSAPPVPLSLAPDEGAAPLSRYRAIAWFATGLLCLVSARAWFPGAGGTPNYRYSFLFLVPLVWFALRLRERLHLRPLHLALFAAALLLHDRGAFGCYTERYLGLEFDAYVHSYFGFVAGLVLAHWIQIEFHPTRLELAIAVVLLVTGMGGLHEIMEGLSTWWLGKDGMLKLDGDPFDTQKDLANNVIGSLAAVLVSRSTKR